jgi:hypothetical protein
VQQVEPAPYTLAPSPLIRVATMEDAPFVSALMGQDASEAMARVVTLISDHGFFFLETITPSVLEAHMAFTSEGRGKEALYAARAGLLYCFTALNALVVFGRIPVEDKPARMFTRLIGLRSFGIRPNIPGGPEAEWFEIRKDEICRLQP